MKSSYYHKALIVVVVGIFYTNVPLYLFISQGITGLEAPKGWMLGLCLVSLPVLFRQMTGWDALKSPAALWCLGYASLTVLWFFLSPQSDMNWQEVRWRFLAIIDLLVFLVLFWNPDANRLARQTLVAAVLVGVAINIYELFVPMSFSRVLGRSAGMYMDPNVTAEALVVGMIFGITVLAPRYRSHFILVVGLGVLLTLSRAGMVAWMIAVAGILLVGRVRVKSLVVSGFLGLVLVVVVLLPQWDQLLTTWQRTGVINENLQERLAWTMDPSGVSDYSSWQRTYVAKKAWEKLAEHPIIGSGPGASLEAEWGTHNTYLAFMVDHGVIGAMILPLLIMAVTWGVRGQSRDVAIVFGCAVIFLSFFTHTILYREQSLLLFSLMAAMTARSRDTEIKKAVTMEIKGQGAAEAWARS